MFNRYDPRQRKRSSLGFGGALPQNLATSLIRNASKRPEQFNDGDLEAFESEKTQETSLSAHLPEDWPARMDFDEQQFLHRN